MTEKLFLDDPRLRTAAATVISSGIARREADIAPTLSLSTIARRVGSPSAWKTRSIFTFCLDMNQRLSKKILIYRTSSFSSRSNSELQPASRIFAPSEPSKNAACSV